MKKYLTTSGILRVLAAVMLLWAPARHPYSYYTILRFIVCGAGAYSSFVASKEKSPGWTLIFAGIAVLFNPLIPVYLDKANWVPIDCIVAAILLISLFKIYERDIS